MNEEKIALFPGSFDPITIAHVDILARALPLFSKVYIGIGLNSNKQALLSQELREEMIRAVYAGEEKVEVVSYEGLTVEFCSRIGASYILRGIRSSSDFEYEKAISQMNHAMRPEIESVFILSNPGYSAISSSIVRDVMRYGGDVNQFIPEQALAILKAQ
ncbi:phosphopantetheine adenylyltransferase [Anseongella ginsenosidimutans]|uniref:Phosphopantetheine adenylyltransferase n=1 Tax=Anseongella ginsenosidimutans TaxID=496056 RepID=A0A4R3KTT7_9SPHI|nr:pantetheine-phosphate adenylyltransferase [Anseongella ginsenosidimutans]QEC53107.1 pantetheine-phosphate adenylyltransferase [Anseongella ginsenosidimutans]TCS87725.1 phosphopantetheine adenylyltransferase [Anseongella ginsenosidimutans]